VNDSLGPSTGPSQSRSLDALRRSGGIRPELGDLDPAPNARRLQEWVGRVVAGVLVAVLAGACGGVGPSTSDSSDGGGSAAAATSAGSDSSPDAVESSGGGDAADGGSSPDGASPDDLAWVPFGPKDPKIPTPSWPAYNDFAQGNCSGLRAYLDTSDATSAGDFGKAMAAVCAAAVEGRQDQWDVAAGLARADGSGFGNDCLAGIVADLIDRALRWHQRYPGSTPKVRFETVAEQTECGKKDNAETGPDTGGPTDTDAPTDTGGPTDTDAPTDTAAPTDTGSPTETTG
jgi:hypothetical protein